MQVLAGRFLHRAPCICRSQLGTYIADALWTSARGYDGSSSTHTHALQVEFVLRFLDLQLYHLARSFQQQV